VYYKQQFFDERIQLDDDESITEYIILFAVNRAGGQDESI
jgi:hypothetical protein